MKHTSFSLVNLFLSQFDTEEYQGTCSNFKIKKILKIKNGVPYTELLWIRIFFDRSGGEIIARIEFTRDEKHLLDSLNCKRLLEFFVSEKSEPDSYELSLFVQPRSTSYAIDLSDKTLIALMGDALRAWEITLNKSGVKVIRASR